MDKLARQFIPVSNPFRILLLADDAHPADVVLDHIQAIGLHSNHHVTVVNPIVMRFGWSIRTLHFDAIVVHYSICILSDYHLPRPVYKFVKRFQGPRFKSFKTNTAGSIA